MSTEHEQFLDLVELYGKTGRERDELKHMYKSLAIDYNAKTDEAQRLAALLERAIPLVRQGRGWLTWQADIDIVDAWLSEAAPAEGSGGDA